MNADEIAKGLEERGEKHAMIKAGRIFFQRLHSYLDKGENFVVETTLSGSYINKVVVKAKAKGYTVSIIYIFIDNVEVSIQRVRDRVEKGGHDVPLEDIIRRFDRSKKNFWENFTEIVNEWILIYNGNEGFQLAASGKEGKYGIENGLLIDLFLKNLK